MLGLLLILAEAIIWKKQRKTNFEFPSTVFTEKADEGVTTAELPSK